MHRRLPTIALGLAAAGVLVLAGCAKPGAAATWVKASFVAPKVGDCYNQRPSDQWSRLTNVPQACTASHYQETAYVGALPPVKSGGTTPPVTSADEYAQCQVEAGKYLGGDVHDARVTVHVTMPSNRDWELGARWFRCDLTTYTDFDERTDAVSASVPLRDGMTGEGPAALRCIDTPDTENDTITSMPIVECTESHNAEFAGYSLAPDGDYPEDEAMQKLGDSCERLIDEYIGAFRNEKFLGYIWYIPSRSEWGLGDRTVSCFVAGFDGHHWSTSLKNLGNKPFPK